MTWMLFLCGCLATYRMALLLSKEDGPAYVFRKLRNVPPKKSSMHDGIRCLFCASVWMSSLVTTFYWWRGWIEPMDIGLYGLAFSAVAICLNQMFTKDF